MQKMFVSGEPVPWFRAPALSGNPRYAFDSAAGRWMVMLFLGSAGQEAAAGPLATLAAHRDLFDDDRACFFGVTIDPQDAAQDRIAQSLPGIRWFLDYEGEVSSQYGAAKVEGGKVTYTPFWLLVDPMLRVRRQVPLAQGGEIMAELRGLLDRPVELPTAPVLVLPGILPPDLCRRLIDLYDGHGGEESGFMREENGITVHKMDHSHKRRADYHIEDIKLVDALKALMGRTIRPMMERAFQFRSTRIERFMVACYDGAVGGHFRPHRDNTTKGTAHRKFACTINLNADDYEGGDLRFPEYGQRLYRAPTGGAVLFSCSMLHEATPVTRGRRYAFLPFFYDDDGARLREANMAFVAPELQGYQAGLETQGGTGR